MATSIGIKVPKKKARASTIVRRGNKLKDPSWENWENWSGVEFHKFRNHTHTWYYENFKPSDLYPSAFEWMTNNGYTKEQIAHAKAAPATMIGVTTGILTKMMNCGMPDINPKHNEHWQSLPGTMGVMKPASQFIRKQLERVIEAGSKIAKVEEVVDTAANTYVPTIQERIREQAYLQSEAIDEWLETWITDKSSFDPKGFNFKVHFQKTGVTQAHARKLKSFFDKELVDFQDLERMPTAGQLKKMDEHEADMWEQLKEGYAHLKKADIKNYTIAIEGLLQALDFVTETAKATRAPRKAKPKSADKLVTKLKYLKTDDKYKLASFNPVDIIGASEIWIFNTKTRKLGKYVAKNIDPKGMNRDGSGLSVKGTTIIGYDEQLSVQKTLRKPEEQLKDFKAAGKVKLRTFLDDIATTDTMLNGRCNLDTILLKVV
tara:strand:+ start:54 stop:1349 length:1296 start_codon:yes stop_codon:yes gene_type:complete